MKKLIVDFRNLEVEDVGDKARYKGFIKVGDEILEAHGDELLWDDFGVEIYEAVFGKDWDEIEQDFFYNFFTTGIFNREDILFELSWPENIERIDQIEIKKIPSQKLHSPPNLNFTNLTALMPAPIRCTLPLSNVLKAKLELWEEVAKYLKSIGVEMPIMEHNHFHTTKSTKANGNIEPVPLNKVGDCREGEDSNTTILVEFKGTNTLAILDSGAGVAIATKKIWESWGRPTLRKTRMKLQLVDGHIERPIGLVEGIVVTSCGVEYEHTFVVVYFGRSPNYDISLGQPFMR